MRVHFNDPYMAADVQERIEHKAFIEHEVEFKLAGRQPGNCVMDLDICAIYNHPTSGRLVVELRPDVGDLQKREHRPRKKRQETTDE